MFNIMHTAVIIIWHSKCKVVTLVLPALLTTGEYISRSVSW